MLTQKITYLVQIAALLFVTTSCVEDAEVPSTEKVEEAKDLRPTGASKSDEDGPWNYRAEVYADETKIHDNYYEELFDTAGTKRVKPHLFHYLVTPGETYAIELMATRWFPEYDADMIKVFDGPTGNLIASGSMPFPNGKLNHLDDTVRITIILTAQSSDYWVGVMPPAANGSIYTPYNLRIRNINEGCVDDRGFFYFAEDQWATATSLCTCESPLFSENTISCQAN